MLRSAIRGGVFLCVGLAVFIARAQAAPVSGGSYQVLEGGSPVGTERFEWTTDESGRTVLTGSVVREIQGVSSTLTTSLTFRDDTLVPAEYRRELQRGDDLEGVETSFDGGRATQVTHQRDTTSRRTLKIKPAGMVVDGSMLHLYTVLARLYDFDRGGEQDIVVYDPTARQSYVAHAMIRGLGTFENNRGTWRLQRLTINLDSVAVDLLVDPEGIVPQISVPLAGMEARLEGYQGRDQAARVN